MKENLVHKIGLFCFVIGIIGLNIENYYVIMFANNFMGFF